MLSGHHTQHENQALEKEEEEKGIPSSRDHMHTVMGDSLPWFRDSELIGELRREGLPGEQGAVGQVRKTIERQSEEGEET